MSSQELGCSTKWFYVKLDEQVKMLKDLIHKHFPSEEIRRYNQKYLKFETCLEDNCNIKL